MQLYYAVGIISILLLLFLIAQNKIKPYHRPLTNDHGGGGWRWPPIPKVTRSSENLIINVEKSEARQAKRPCKHITPMRSRGKLLKTIASRNYISTNTTYK